jgi:hypothetical protein
VQLGKHIRVGRPGVEGQRGIDAGGSLGEWKRGDRGAFPVVSETQGEYLQILIPAWLAGLLEIEEGDLVRVQSDGRLHIRAPETVAVN